MGFLSFVVNLPSKLGAALSANSLPVVIASDQTVPVYTKNVQATGTLAALNDSVTLNTDSLGSVGVSLTGTNAGATVIFEGLVAGSTWDTIKVYPLIVGAGGVTSASAAGDFEFNCGSFKQIRVRLSVAGSGSFSCSLNGTQALRHVGVKNGNASDLQATVVSADLGTKADATWTGSPSLTPSLIAIARAISEQGLGATQNVVAPIPDQVQIGVLAPSTNGVLFVQDMSGYKSLSVQFMGGDSVSTYVFEGTNDLLSQTWEMLPWEVNTAGYASIGIGTLMPPSGSAFSYVTAKRTQFIRVRCVTSTTTHPTRWMSCASSSPINPRKELPVESAWTYATASGGITNNSSVALSAASNPTIVRAITALQIGNSGSSGSEVTISDNATVIWRGWVAPSQPMTAIQLLQPLKSSRGNALNFAAVATSGIAIYVNAQGVLAI